MKAYPIVSVSFPPLEISHCVVELKVNWIVALHLECSLLFRRCLAVVHGKVSDGNLELGQNKSVDLSLNGRSRGLQISS